MQGSGPHGRIVARDIEGAKGGAGLRALTPVTARSAEMPAGMPDDKIRALFEEGSYEFVPHDLMRKAIARRLTESKLTIPHYYLSIDCQIDELLKAREEINSSTPKGADGKPRFKLSVNDFVIKALALALIKVPDANVSWTEAGMLKHKHADVGVAVAIKGGLITPIIRHAEEKRSAPSPTRCATLGCARATASSSPTNMKAARRRSPTSACTASRNSPP